MLEKYFSQYQKKNPLSIYTPKFLYLCVVYYELVITIDRIAKKEAHKGRLLFYCLSLLLTQ